jgi:hypothetical protein
MFPGTVTSGSTGMDSLLECLALGARGLLPLRSIVVSAYDRRYSRPTMGDTYPYRGAPGRVKAWVPFSGNWVRWIGGEIPSACT